MAMRGTEFEKKLCLLMKSLGFWALQIPRSPSGSQPFDIIAVKDGKVFAVDCKVCVAKTFPISRIEDNQWLAFDEIQRRGGKAGIMILHDGDVYYYDYTLLIGLNTDKSVKLDTSHIIYSKRRIQDIVGEIWE